MLNQLAGLEILYWTVIVIYLAFLAIAGWLAKKKTKTLKDYMVAGRKIGPLLLGLSFGVTYFSAVLIVGGGQFAWNWGLSVIWIATIDVLIGVFIIFVLFGPKTKALGEHFDSLTVPQLLSKRYQDPKIQTFSSVVILFFETVYLVSIFMGLSILLSVTFPGNPYAYIVAVTICAVITIFYLNVGGAHGAIWTDAVESVIMLVGVSLIFFFALYAVGGFDSLLGTLGNIERSEGLKPGSLKVFPGAGGFGVIGYILVTSFGVWGMPQMISRFYTAEKQKSIRWGLVIVCIWAFIIALFAWFNGVLARAYFWEHDKSTYNAIADAKGETAVPMLMIAVLPPILVAIFLAAVLAASLTTGEKVIMVAASGFSIDVYQVKTGASDDKTLHMTKIATTVLVVIAAILALLKPAMVLALCMFAWSAMAAVILIPYVFGLVWKGGTKKAVMWSGAVSLLSAILWFILFRPDAPTAWGAFGLTYPKALRDIAALRIIPTPWFVISIGSIHEFIISQLIAIIAFPIISLLTRGSKPSKEFLNEIFGVMKKAKTEE